jgi:hypothetical protein
MSVAGTLYEETVKFGHGKLLSSQTASGQLNLTFIAPFTSEFNTYHFDVVNVTMDTRSQFFGCQLSNNGGASWLSGCWYTNSYVCSHSNVFGNEAYPMIGLNSDCIRLTGNAYENNAVSGEIIMHCAPGKAMTFQAHITINHVSYGHMGMITGSALDAGANGIRFFCYGGRLVSGTIRMYGLRSGLV